MQGNLSDLSADILKEVLATTKNAIEFGKTELPLVVHEILTYQAVRGAIIALILLALIIGGIWLIRLIDKETKDEVGDALGVMAAIGIITLVMFWAFVVQLLNIAKIVFAPRLYIIEYLTDLMK